VRYLETVADFDVRHMLPQIKIPTLIHVRDDRRVPVALGREMAAAIPGARFVVLSGQNHVSMMPELLAAK
jgi:pimeloyl-ACP methyl ester carboxylesterase